MTIRTSYRLLIESEQGSEDPRSLVIDSRGDSSEGRTLILEWVDPDHAMDHRHSHYVELNRGEALELIGAIGSALEIESPEVEGVLSSNHQE